MGTLTIRETKGNMKETVAAQAGDGVITAPVVLLVDQSTARAGEVFAAALDGNKRAEMIGEHTLGSAARPKTRQAARRQRDAALLSPVPRAWRRRDSREGIAA